jgi:hypothetical protein
VSNESLARMNVPEDIETLLCRGSGGDPRIHTGQPMFIMWYSLYINAILVWEGWMATVRARSHKHFQLDAAKLRRAQRMLRADTETEAIERALDIVIAEHERNQLTVEANDHFVSSGIDIEDAYGTLEK